MLVVVLPGEASVTFNTSVAFSVAFSVAPSQPTFSCLQHHSFLLFAHHRFQWARPPLQSKSCPFTSTRVEDDVLVRVVVIVVIVEEVADDDFPPFLYRKGRLSESRLIGIAVDVVVGPGVPDVHSPEASSTARISEVPCLQHHSFFVLDQPHFQLLRPASQLGVSEPVGASGIVGQPKFQFRQHQATFSCDHADFEPTFLQ